MTTKKEIISNHPQKEEITIKTNQGIDVITSSYKMSSASNREDRNTNLKDIKSLEQKNDFANKNLETISAQLDMIETRGN